MARRRMTTHTLNPAKGWPRPSALDFAAKFDATQLATVSGLVAFAGRCVHLSDAGRYKFGCDGRAMPLFIFQNSDDPDVANDGGDATADTGVWVAVAPTGVIMALVAVGAYELETTEFDSAQTYKPNDTLAAPTGTTLATCGVLTNQSATPYTNAVVGVVSRGKYTNSFGFSVLAFWPVYCPLASAVAN